ncbi:MAG: ABC transporter substrate-binding protein [Clostridium sp.]
MKFKRLIAMLLVSVMTVTLFAGCTKSSTASDEKTTITDHAGREVKVTGNYNKIVSGYYISTSLLISLGLKDKLIGIEAQGNKRPIYKMVDEKILSLPNVGTAKDFDLEGCISLKPDLVILPKKLVEEAKTLEEMGITVIVVNPENDKLLKETAQIIGKATGTEERANKLISYYDTKYEMLNKVSKDLENKPKVYLSGMSDILESSTSSMYQNTVIEKAGGVNASKELTDKKWAKISYEQLITYNPDIIVIASGAKYKKQDILNNKQLSNINAVKNNAVYTMPSSIEAWDSPVPAGILGTMWLSSIINEKEYSFDKFKDDVVGFYKEFYGIDIDKSLITK